MTQLIATLTNTSLWGAIIASITIIALGFLLAKFKWFKAEWKKVLVGVVMKVGLPALVLVGFMKSVTLGELKSQGIVLGISFAFYIILSISAWLWIRFMPSKTPKSVINAKEGTLIGEMSNTTSIDDSRHRAMVMWMLLIFGSTTFFGMPIITELYRNDGGLLAANIWNVPYRIFLYSFAFMQMKGLKFNKENIKKSAKTIFVNPIIIATFLGLIFWLTQTIPGAGAGAQELTAPKELTIKGGTVSATLMNHYAANFSNIYGVTNGEGKTQWYIYNVAQHIYVPYAGKVGGWFTFDITMPYFHKFILILGKLCSPLIWLAIGMTLAQSSLKAAVKDKWVWIYSTIKMVLIPLAIFAIFFVLNRYAGVGKGIAVSMLIFAATPPATVAVAYAINENKCANLAASCSALSTLLAVIFIPLWIVIGEVSFIGA